MVKTLKEMRKKQIKNFLILFLPLICLSQNSAFANELEKNNKILIKDEPLQANPNNIENKFEDAFSDYQSFEDSIKPGHQFLNLLGLGGFSERRLKKSSFNLWDTYKKEMSNQTGNKRLSGTDINNTFNESIKTLGN